MFQLSPGLTYLWHHFPRLLVTTMGLHFVVRLVRTVFNASFPFAVSTAVIFLLAFLLLQCAVTNAVYQRRALVKGAALPPAIKQSTFSNVYSLFVGLRHGYPGDVFALWSHKYGNTFRVHLPTDTIIYTDDPQHIKTMLVTQFDSFEKGSTLQSQLHSLLGRGIFNADGDMWRFHRSIIRPFFSRERINEFQMLDRACKATLILADNRLSEGFCVDIQDLVSRFSLDSTTEFLFGRSVDSLSAGIKYPPLSTKINPSSSSHPSNQFVEAFGAGQAGSIERVSLGSDWPLSELCKDKVLPFRKVIDEFIQPLVDKACEKWKTTGGSGDTNTEDDALLEYLATKTEDVSIIKDELINLLVAGRDTTTCLLSFSVYMMSKNPHIETRLRKEVSEKIGIDTDYCPSHEQLSSLKYMRAFINEVLRLYPPVPVNNRKSKRDTLLPASHATAKPFYVPANTTCFYGIINLHRRTDLWGPDALEFDPDRFLDERLGKYLTPNPFIFSPFSTGPRLCIGQEFAYCSATLFLVGLLRNFSDFSIDKLATVVTPPQHWATEGNRKNTEEVYPVSYLTMFIKGGIWMKMKRLRTDMKDVGS